MAKVEWGFKRSCTSCGARFYDLRRDPVTCPKCGTVVEPVAIVKPRRGRAPAVVVEKEVAEKPAAEAIVKRTVVSKEVKAEEGEPEKGEAEEGDLIEDASELGEDEDDMAEVIEGIDEEEEER